MLQNLSLYTVESVLAGHPDKICDQISDAVLDAYLSLDEDAKVGVECLGTYNLLVVGGEISSKCKIELEPVIAEVFSTIGMDNDIQIIDRINAQSSEIRPHTEKGNAGDQGIMYGYAISYPEYNYLPKGVFLVHKLSKEIDEFRKLKNYILPDGKVQLTLNDDKVETVIIRCQHRLNQNLKELKGKINDSVINNVFSGESIKNIYFNHESEFTKGGFHADAGLTGRKIMVDTYCGLIPHGGGGFSGKDPSKVDRSAAYFARFVAKSIVANGLAKECLISVAYGFGLSEPVMINVITENGKVQKLQKLVEQKFDFSPNSIIEVLNLKKIKYLPTATYGHFSNPDYPWEQIKDL